MNSSRTDNTRDRYNTMMVKVPKSIPSTAFVRPLGQKQNPIQFDKSYNYQGYTNVLGIKVRNNG